MNNQTTKTHNAPDTFTQVKGAAWQAYLATPEGERYDALLEAIDAVASACADANAHELTIAIRNAVGAL